ncbi:MAG: hypothetical protein ACYS14_07320 [Planctomycetota bacterium]|jgi:hypothetical protein
MTTIRDHESKVLALAAALCVFVFAFAGCRQQEQQEEAVLAAAPEAAGVSIPSEYAAQAIEAAGGLDAWTKTRELRLDCVVTMYQPDDSYYLSQQSYQVYPWSNSIQISAAEPQGEIVWQLSRGEFDVLQGASQIDELSGALQSHCLAESILKIVTAPARLLDTSVQFVKQDAAVKIQGQWYYPIDSQAQLATGSGEEMTKTVLYQNRDNALIDLLQIGCTESGKSLAVRGYDYDEIEKGGVLIPARIEVFTTDGQGGSQMRLIKMDLSQAEGA